MPDSILGRCEYTVERDGQALAVTVPVWVRPGSTKVISAVCKLSPEEPPQWANVTEKGQYWRFSFVIVETELFTGTDDYQISDRRKAAKYIPEHLRSSVMPAVCKATCALIRHVKPDFGWGVTYEQHPFGRQLERYYMLINSLRSEGYSVDREVKDPKGRFFWIMKPEDSSGS